MPRRALRACVCLVLAARVHADTKTPAKAASRELAWSDTEVEPGTTWWCYAGGYDDDDCVRTKEECARRHATCKEQTHAHVHEAGANGKISSFHAFRTRRGCEEGRKQTFKIKPLVPTDVWMATQCKRIGRVKVPEPKVKPGTGFTCFTFDIRGVPGSQCNRTDVEVCKRREAVSGRLPLTIQQSCAPRDTAWALQSWQAPDEEAALFENQASCEVRRKLGRYGPCTLVH